MEESCYESESEIEVSSNSDSYFSNESDTRTVDSVAPNELLDNLVSCYWKNPYILTLMLEINQLLTLSRKSRAQL